MYEPTRPKIQFYGWRPDAPDRRDRYFNVSAPSQLILPPSIDLRGECPPVYNQGELGSCTANALAAAFEYDEIFEKKPGAFTPSRLFIYYNERYIEFSTFFDSGATLRDGIKSMAAWGVANEKAWPYAIEKYAERPAQVAYIDAKEHVISDYRRLVQKLDDLRACLAGSRPFVLGFSVYQSFESEDVAMTGEVPMPGRQEVAIGGHAVLVVGYDDKTSRFKARNSWGDKWGDGGYFTIPYEYVLNPDLSGDLWTIRTV